MELCAVSLVTSAVALCATLTINTQADDVAMRTDSFPPRVVAKTTRPGSSVSKKRQRSLERDSRDQRSPRPMPL